jgi:hypothetical protein
MTNILSKINRTPADVRDTIRSWWDRASDGQREAGASWYARTMQAAEDMAIVGGHTIEQCAAVIAHLSPKNQWLRNVQLSWEIVETGTASGYLQKNIDKAIAAYNSDDPFSTFKGPKTRAFVRNCSGDSSAVTIDVWMIRALGITVNELNRKGIYDALAAEFVNVADEIGITPATLQATIWVVAKGSDGWANVA